MIVITTPAGQIGRQVRMKKAQWLLLASWP